MLTIYITDANSRRKSVGCKENYGRSNLSLTFIETIVDTNDIPFTDDEKSIFFLLHHWFRFKLPQFRTRFAAFSR